MILIIFFLWTVWTLQLLMVSSGSLVIDKLKKGGINYAEYCPKMKYCSEGSHVMCMYFKPNQSTAAGPKCNNFQNISVSFEIAEKLIDLVNEIRGKVAMGKETGKEHAPLPKAYGLFKLKWDNELATFAQVLANTCTFKRDLCRATSKFPDPGQMVSAVRFTVPDWFPVEHTGIFFEKGLTKNKIEYAAKESIKAWYSKKKLVTPDMLRRMPDFYSQSSSKKTAGTGEPLRYLQLVDSSTTHIGCGLSAYVQQPQMHITEKQPPTNFIHVVCNFSAKPQKGTEVFKVENPFDNQNEGHYSECGCPVGTESDDMCLCSLSEASDSSCDKNQSCKPTDVLLPIFTMDDALLKNLKRGGLEDEKNDVFNVEKTANDFGSLSIIRHVTANEDRSKEPAGHYVMKSIGLPYTSKIIPTTLEYPNELDEKGEKIPGSFVSNINAPISTASESLLPASIQFRSVPTSLVNPQSPSPFVDSPLHIPPSPDTALVKYNIKRHSFPSDYPLPDLGPYLSGKEASESTNFIRNNVPEAVVRKRRKESILASAPRFSLLRPLKNQTPITQNLNEFNPHEVSGMDLIKAQQLIQTYLSQAKPPSTFMGPQQTQTNSIITPTIDSKNIYFLNKTSPASYVNLSAIVNPYYPVPDPIKTVDVTIASEDLDQKLMTLLDTLEQEVQNIELGDSQKEIFDAKIRKIYGTAVGRTPVFTMGRGDRIQSPPKPEPDLDDNYPLDAIEEPNKKIIEKEMFDAEDKVNEVNPYDNYPYNNRIDTQTNTANLFEDQEKGRSNLKDTFKMLDEIKARLNKKKEPKGHFKTDRFGRPQPVLSTKYENRNLKYKNPRLTKVRPMFEHKKNKGNPHNKGSRGRNRYSEGRYYPDNDDDRGRDYNNIDEYISKEMYPKNDYLSDEVESRPINYFTDKNKIKKYDDYDSTGLDLLSIERRKYYQKKLDNLQGKSRIPPMSYRHNDHEKVRARRLLRVQGEERSHRERIRPIEESSQHFYKHSRYLNPHL